MRDDFLAFAPPSIGEEEIEEVVDTLRSGWITTGPKVHAFEKQFAHFVNAESALAVSSGTGGPQASQGDMEGGHLAGRVDLDLYRHPLGAVQADGLHPGHLLEQAAMPPHLHPTRGGVPPGLDDNYHAAVVIVAPASGLQCLM